MKRTLVKLGMATLVASALVGCGGGGGSDGAPGASATNGGNTTTTVATPGVNAQALTADQFAALNPVGTIQSVTVNSAPVVNFTLTDGSGNSITGLAINSTAAGQVVPTQRNVVATIAKLVPGTNGSPSTWVNYIVTNIDMATGAETTPRTPTTDGNGALTYNSTTGVYTYTFSRDIKQAQAKLDAATYSGNNVRADLGDVSWEPDKIHRIVLQIYGPAPGSYTSSTTTTSCNTPDGTCTNSAANAGITILGAYVPMENPINVVYDWIPATGQVIGAADTTQREIVKINACNECHSKLAFHGGGRLDTKYCVTCHTTQRKYGQSAATLATKTITYDDGSTETVPAWSKEPRKFPNNEAFRDFPILIHGIHRGEHLPVKANATYVDEVVFPQPITNCTKCHDGSATATNKTAQGDNWKTKPNRKACGACHNNVDFATGTNHPAPGGIRTDDSQCTTCHTADTIASIYHVSVDPEGSSGRAGYPANTALNTPTAGYPSGQGPSIPLASLTNPPAGVYKIGLEIDAVTVASNKATVKYRILKDGTPVTLNASGYLIDNVDGTPNIYVTYGQVQDGVTSAVDWTGSISVTVLQCRNQDATKCTQTGPDASGWYTATLVAALPADAKMVTGELGINYQGFVQLNHPAYPNGIRLRESAFAIKTATGHTARRTIVSAAKCNNCHAQLGVEPSFHGGARNNPQGCATGGCHAATRATGHTDGGGWSISAKNMVHSIHGASKREQAFSYEATAQNNEGFGIIAYPGVLSQCTQCHESGSYDFSNSTNAAAVPNLLWSTDTALNLTGLTPIGLSPWITSTLLGGQGLTDYRTNQLVSSPLASTCFGCHDSTTAITHMKQNGGKLVTQISTVTSDGSTDRSKLVNTETCLVCHGSGKTADIRLVHGVK